MARIDLDVTTWVDLTTEATLTDGSTYWLQANRGDNMDAENIYFSKAEPDTLKDGLLGHDFKFKYASGDKVYVRSISGNTSLKIEEVE